MNQLIRLGCKITVAVCAQIIDAIDGRPNMDDPLEVAPPEPFYGWSMCDEDARRERQRYLLGMTSDELAAYEGRQRADDEAGW